MLGMDDSSYPLAQADHAYAYEGAYRTPNAMSAATRDAYGMRGKCEVHAPKDFRTSLRAAASHAGVAAAALGPRRSPTRSLADLRYAHGGTRIGVPASTPDRARIADCAPVRVPPRSRRPSSFYYLFTSAAGCAVRAIVWRGRVYCGGRRQCPTSTP